MWESDAWREKNALGRAKQAVVKATHHQGSTTVSGCAQRYVAHHNVPVPNTYQAFHMANLASAEKAKSYDPATPGSSYNKPTELRKGKYDDGFKKTRGEHADPSSEDLIPELVMGTGEGKKHGRPSLGAAFPLETDSLSSLRARSTSSSLQIQRREKPARELRAELEANMQETQQMRQEMETIAVPNTALEEWQRQMQEAMHAQMAAIANIYRAQGMTVPEMPP